MRPKRNNLIDLLLKQDALNRRKFLHSSANGLGTILLGSLLGSTLDCKKARPQFFELA